MDLTSGLECMTYLALKHEESAIKLQDLLHQPSLTFHMFQVSENRKGGQAGSAAAGVGGSGPGGLGEPGQAAGGVVA